MYINIPTLDNYNYKLGLQTNYHVKHITVWNL